MDWILGEIPANFAGFADYLSAFDAAARALHAEREGMMVTAGVYVPVLIHVFRQGKHI